MSGPYRELPRRVEPAPRVVPRRLVWQLRLGGTLGLLGWLFLTIGSLILWIFVAASDVTIVTGPSDRVVGVVTGHARTSVSVNRQPVHEVQFTYGDGRRGRSYKRGRLPPVGTEVPVDVQRNDPAAAVIVGMDRSAAPLWVLAIIAIFPIVGLSFVLARLARSRRELRLLREGQPALGRLVDKRRTNVQINKAYVYELTFEFEGELGRQHRASVRTHQTERLEDDPEEVLLYDRHDPSAALPLDHLPGSPRIDEAGHLHATVSDTAATGVWILPVIAVVVNLLGAMAALAS